MEIVICLLAQGLSLRNFVRQQKLGTNSQTHTLLTKYNYDRNGGRLTSINKQADAQTEKQIVSYSYTELGQLKSRTLGGNLETQNLTYNIQGSLRGINKTYAQAQTDTSWFGEELNYDYGFTQNKLDGNIAGVKWRSKGDGEQRAYGYTYDPAGRLIKADFSQNNSGWNTSAGVDYTVSSLNYDANGNILSLTQKGLKINSSPIIDSLLYGYTTNSNQLLYVTDKANDTTAHLGDFTEINNNTSQDYWYDGNGNFTKDNNKNISSITYNFLNLPQTINVTGKGTITYTYDATGMKLQKKITEGSRIVTTTYIGGFVYKNDTLQYILNEEGRIRPSTKGLPSLVYDYFVKDHLGNIRMVLTEEKDTSIYPVATFEDADLATDTLYYDNASSQRTARPGSFYTSTSNGSMVQLLRKNVQSVGAGKILKVMSGDKLDIKVDYYIPTATTDNSAANGLNSIITSLTTLINTDPVTVPLHGSGGSITTALNNSTPFTNFIAPENGTAGTTLPKAYLNIVFFDEQFKFVSQNSEVVQVTTEGSGQTIYRLGGTAKTATKNGFVYIYVSNESNNLVYFDNLQITHEHGPLVQEDHYYPYGLGMAGISSSAISGIVANAYKANGGTELGSGEWADGKGLELYETTYRSYDAQIGRFMQVDPLMESSANFGGYAFVIDNPSFYTDPFGLRETHQQEGPVNNADYSIFWDGVIDQYLTTGKVTWPLNEDGNGGDGGEDAYPTDADYKSLDEVKVKGNDNSWKKTLQDLLDEDGPRHPKKKESANHWIAPVLIGLGQPIDYLKRIGALGSKKGSSIISTVLSKIPIKSPVRLMSPVIDNNGIRWVGTKLIGRFLGRWVPIVGWALLSKDFTEGVAMPMSEGNALYEESNRRSGNWIANLPH